MAYWASSFRQTPPEWACDPRSNAKNGHGPFDTFALAMPDEAAADLVAGRGTSRLTPNDVALLVLADAKAARAASTVAIDPSNVEARDYVRECIALADLGDLVRAQVWRGCVGAARRVRAHGERGLARSPPRNRKRRWPSRPSPRSLPLTSYLALPWFDDRMRMQALGLLPFHWRDELARLPLDAASITAVVAAVRASPPAAPRPGLPSPAAWLNTPRAWARPEGSRHRSHADARTRRSGP